MADKVLMKGNEAIAEARYPGRMHALFWISHNAADRSSGIYGKENAEDRRLLLTGRKRSRAINMVYGVASTGKRVMTRLHRRESP